MVLRLGGRPDHSRMVAAITFAGVCYGGLHLVAWTNTFPSHVALVLWRSASITILLTGPFCVVIAACNAGVDWLSRRSLFRRHHFLDDGLTLACLCLIVLSFIWYTLCRTFIVVECFILLAHIPESALRVPTWAAYIPSFG
jgi:integral membrane sensor domain MASE1